MTSYHFADGDRGGITYVKYSPRSKFVKSTQHNAECVKTVYIRIDPDLTKGAAGPPQWEMLRDRIPVDIVEDVCFPDRIMPYVYTPDEDLKEPTSHLVAHVHECFLNHLEQGDGVEKRSKKQKWKERCWKKQFH